MADPYIGEIKMFGFNFPPRNYTLCYGQLLSISQYTSVFSLLGTYFGGDGRTTFGIPELRGRSAIGQGDGPVTYPYTMGSIGGSESQTLTTNNLPSHNHSATFAGGSASATTTVNASKNPATVSSPSNGDYLAVPAEGRTLYSGYIPDADKGETFTLAGVTTTVASAGQVVVGNTGQNAAFDNRSPYLAVNFCLALDGLYPPRN